MPTHRAHRCNDGSNRCPCRPHTVPVVAPSDGGTVPRRGHRISRLASHSGRMVPLDVARRLARSNSRGTCPWPDWCELCAWLANERALRASQMVSEGLISRETAREEWSPYTLTTEPAEDGGTENQRSASDTPGQWDPSLYYLGQQRSSSRSTS